MTGAGNPLNYDYRDPRHVERYNKLVIRHPTGETEGKPPRTPTSTSCARSTTRRRCCG
jgi:hypothetical protein